LVEKLSRAEFVYQKTRSLACASAQRKREDVLRRALAVEGKSVQSWLDLYRRGTA